MLFIKQEERERKLNSGNILLTTALNVIKYRYWDFTATNKDPKSLSGIIDHKPISNVGDVSEHQRKLGVIGFSKEIELAAFFRSLFFFCAENRPEKIEEWLMCHQQMKRLINGRNIYDNYLKWAVSTPK